MKNVYVGRSGQLWFEVRREGDMVRLMPETYSYGYPRSLLILSKHIETVCGLRLVGTHTDFKTVQLINPLQGEVYGQEESQSVPETVPREVRFQAYHEAWRRAAQAIDKGFIPAGQKCKESSGTGYYRHQLCTYCKGTGYEPTPKVEPNDTNSIEHSEDFKATSDEDRDFFGC